jgi:hypothetical protein
LHDDELHNYVGDEMKESVRACMAEKRNAYRSTVRKHVGKRQLTRPIHKGKGRAFPVTGHEGP